jgi:hypothetical protein
VVCTPGWNELRLGIVEMFGPVEPRRRTLRGVGWIAIGLILLGAGLVWMRLPRVTVCTFPGKRRTDAEAVMSALALYRTDNPRGPACPSVEQLWEERYLGRNVAVEDAWGERLWMECREGRVVLWSAGPDLIRGTDDDVAWLED